MRTSPLRLHVNGRTTRTEVHPLQTLASVLRDDLRLTGTKVGCDAGDCGACTVVMNGAPVCACIVPTGQCDGADIRTIEGLAASKTGRRLQDAFLAHGAAQCGICSPGMLMAAEALLRTNPEPTRADIETAIGGVLCRCTGYIKIIDAIASAVTHEGTSTPEAGGVGERIQRADGQPKVDGRELYGADFAPEGALDLRVIRSPHARATYSFGDLGAFKARHPGLVAVVTARDVPGANSFGIFPTTKDQPVFAESHVRYRGEAIAALVGSRDAVAAISDVDLPIEWKPEQPIVGIQSALATGAPALHAHLPDNVLTRGYLKRGDASAVSRSAAAVAEGRFTTAFVEHAYIEPEAGYAIPDADGPGTMLVAATTQAPYMDREETARVLGVDQDLVRIVPTACGGGFGGKLDVSVQPILAVAARVTGRPVRLVYSRIESMASSTKRHPAEIFARASADRNGRLVSYEMDGDFDTGAYASWGPTVANRVPIHGAGPYRVPNVLNKTRAIFTNAPPSGAFRGFGIPQASIANETLMDDLAEKLGIDRWEIRRRNALGVGDTTYTGQLLTASAGLPQCLDALRPAWIKALGDADAHNRQSARLKRGAGIACMWYGCGNTSLSNPSAMRITLGADGRVTLWSGAVDIGQGVSTVLLQIATEALAISGVRVELCDAVGDTKLTLDAGKTSASRQTFVSGNAARLAALELRHSILRLANAGDGAPMRLDGKTIVVGGREERHIALSDLPIRDGAVLEGFGHYDPPTTALDADGQGVPYATYGFAAQIAEVEVDLALGTTRVLHIHAAHDVGRAINPTLVEGQIHGGIAQGLGLALMEEYIPGRTENLHDYLIPTAGDVPPITTYIIEDPDPEGPYGAKGVGEPALIATAPAILGAIRHATGVTIRRVPVLPHRLWEALQAKENPA